MTITEVIGRAAPSFSAAERRVAEAVVADPASVAFGTVADLAERSGVGAATVVRFAAKAGFEGFAALQRAVQDEGVGSLRPAASRIRQVGAATRPRAADASVATTVVEASLTRATPAAIDGISRLLATAPAVFIVAGEGCDMVGRLLADRLDALRPGVARIEGSPVASTRVAARVADFDAVVAVDIARYDAWLVDLLDRLSVPPARVVALTDSPLGPLASRAGHLVLAGTSSSGPFDSLVGMVAVAELVIDAVAARIRKRATTRLDAVESAWSAADVLLDP